MIYYHLEIKIILNHNFMKYLINLNYQYLNKYKYSFNDGETNKNKRICYNFYKNK